MQKTKVNNYPMLTPIPLVLVGAEVNGKPNYAAVGACGVVCLEPVIYIALKNTHYTTDGVRENGYFSVNIPPADLIQKTDYCGVVSGKNTDKSQLFNSFYDAAGKAPMISECPLNLLCQVFQSVPIRGFEVFYGEIVATYLADACFTDGKPDPVKINPTFVMGANYFNLGSSIGSPFQTANTLKSSNFKMSGV